MLDEVVRHGQQRRRIVEQRRNVNGVISSIQQWQVLCTHVVQMCETIDTRISTLIFSFRS